MKNRFLNGVSFLPLFAPEKGAGEGDQPELALDAEAGTDLAEQLEAAAGDDPNDLNHSSADEDKDAETVKAEAEAEPEKVEAEAKEEPEDEKAELEQLRKTAKALGKRVSVLSREKREMSAKLQESIKVVPKDDGEAGDGEEPQRSDFKTKVEFDAAVEAAAEARLAQREFNAACNAVETKGSSAFKDKWARAKADLASLDDNGRIPIEILSVALETDNPALVLFKLGNDLELASEMMGMTPTKRAIAMDKLATAKVAAQQSKAPAPVDPIGGKGARDDSPRDTDSDEEWNRKEAIRERKAAEARRKERGY
jgi:hypothetical protein